MAEEKINESVPEESPLLDYAAAVNGEVPEKKKKSLFGDKKLFKKIKVKSELKVNAFVLFLCAAVLVVVTVFATFLLADKFYYNGYALNKGNKVTFRDENADTMKIAKFQDVLDFINENYYTDYDVNDLIEGAIKGVVDELDDPYSTYYSPDTMDEYISFVEGSYSGIGITVEKKENGYLVAEVAKDSPAEKAGVKIGDIMTAINGESVADMARDKFTKYLKTDGNSLNITFTTADGTSVDRKITVSVIKEQTVTAKQLEGDLVYIRISQFVPGTAESFKFAVDKAVSNPDCKGLIIDLRNNPGGYADEASKIADYILPEGVIATAQNRKGETVKVIKSDANCISIPMSVLINANTASASELLAGAIRDFKYGKLVGVKSYGKALAQINKEYKDDGSGIVLSTSRYFTPSGECIDGVGITPDIATELADEHKSAEIDKIPTGYDIQLYAAMEALGVTSSEKITESAPAEDADDSADEGETAE